MSARCKLELGNNRFVRVCDWRDEVRIDIREYENIIPTKKGISLSLGRWKILAESTDAIDEALKTRNGYSLHLGGNVYCKIAENNVCVNIRQYWSPPDQVGSIFPTKKGICLRPTEYAKLKDVMSAIGDFVPELNGVVPCYLQSDHQNQLGYLRCTECNPNGSTEW